MNCLSIAARRGAISARRGAAARRAATRVVGTATLSTALASVAVLGCSKTSDQEAKNASSAQTEAAHTAAEDEASVPSVEPKEETPGEMKKEDETSSVGPEYMGAEPGGERSTSQSTEGNPKAPAGAQTPGAATDSSHAGADLATQIDHVVLNVRQIATAQCDLEQRCDNIGEEGKYKSREECMRKIEGSYGDLHSGDCKAGLDSLRLDTCLQSIRTTNCASPRDSVEQLAACTEGTLCGD